MLKKLVILLMLLSVVALPQAFASHDEPASEAFPSQRSECEVDLSGETVTFYHFGDLSGAYAFITQPLIAGFDDAASYFNENGGLCGATIGQEFRDTGGAQEQTQAFWDEFSALDDAYSIFLYASADGELLRQQALDADIVLFNAAASELALYGEAGEPGNQYSIIPLYVDQLGAFCDYISANWDDMGMEGDPVIGHLSWEGAFGRSSDTDTTRAYCEEQGVGYAGAEYFLPTAPDVSSQLQSLVDSGANIIYTTSLASGPAQVAGTIDALDLGDSVMMAGANWALDTSVIGLGGASTDGIVGNLPYLWWDELAEPGVQIVSGYWAANRLADDPEAAVQVRNIAYLSAWASLDLWIEGMTRTINRVGSLDGLSGGELNATMEEFQYDALEGILRLDYTDGVRSVRQTRIGNIAFVETDGGVTPTVQPLTEWLEAPDLRTE